MSAPPLHAWPVRVSQDGRYLVGQNGEPFFWLGDTQWDIFLSYSEQDAAAICENRRNQGFSALQIMILGVGGGTRQNLRGDKPFVNDDPLTPNDRYFAHVDSVVEMAGRNNLVCVIGIYHKSDDYARLITLAKARPWARWVGRRYKDFPNIIWSMYPEAKESFTPIVRELAAGLREGDGGRHLITVHPDPSIASSSEPWHNESWLSFNTIQTWHNGPLNYQWVAADYARIPPKPAVNGEARYEGEGGTTPLDLRQGAYWSFLAGGFYTYGHGGNWRSPGTWRAWIDSPGSSHMAVYRKIVTSLPRWWTRVPDQSIFATFVVRPSGRIEEDGLKPALPTAAAARSAAADWILAYLPCPATAAIQMSQIASAAPAEALWVDPRTGDRRLIGNFQTNGQQSFATPAGWEDAVLLVAKPAP